MTVHPSPCQEVEDALGAFALDALDPGEAEAVSAHLVVCPHCREAAGEAVSVVDSFVALIPPGEPPPSLKARLLASASPAARETAPPGPVPIGRKRRDRATAAMAAVAAVLLVGVALLAVALTRVAGERDDALAAAELLSSYVSAGGQLVPLANQNAAIYQGHSPRGSLLLAPGKKPLVVVEGCPKSSDYLSYRVWVARDGERLPVGELWVGENGNGMARLDAAEPITQFDTLGVTAMLPGQRHEDVLVGAITLATE